MQRRELIKRCAAGLGGLVMPSGWFALAGEEEDGVSAAASVPAGDVSVPAGDISVPPSDISIPPGMDLATQKRMQLKIDNFDRDFDDDIYIGKERMRLLKSVQWRLTRARDTIGFAEFNLLGFDQLMTFAAHAAKVGPFTAEEKSFIDEMFAFDARKYGFYGEKPIEKLTACVPDKETVAIRGSGHYIFRGAPQKLYLKIQRDIGKDIILTSGVRSVMKQMQLFLTKAIATRGNLSRASRSLAPPGYSFHGSGDFDVGKVGWGERNFSNQFAKSDVFKRLIDLGYVDIRYTKINYYGVRFEPWHIKVG